MQRDCAFDYRNVFLKCVTHCRKLSLSGKSVRLVRIVLLLKEVAIYWASFAIRSDSRRYLPDYGWLVLLGRASFAISGNKTLSGQRKYAALRHHAVMPLRELMRIYFGVDGLPWPSARVTRW